MMAQHFWWMWCVFLVVGFGACIGSFINVVVYRLPLHIPLRRPLWSFCPNCRTPIRWYDNIPVVSYFLLKGHCRRCGMPISVRYVIVEVITILSFLILFDAFFVASVRDGILAERWTTVAERLYSDWPIFAAHAILFACLLAMSAIDLEEYWVDIRFTHLATLGGFVLHTLWTPHRMPAWPRPGAVFAAGALAATVASVATHLLIAWWAQRRDGDESPEEIDARSQPDSGGGDAEGMPESVPIYLGRRSSRPIAWLVVLVLAFTLGSLAVTLWRQSDPAETAARLHSWTLESDSRGPDTPFLMRIVPGIALIFLAIVASSTIHRDSDRQIEESLESERHTARRTAGGELLMVLPTIAAGIIGVLAVRTGGPLHDLWVAGWDWHAGRQWRPLLGLGTAASGFIIAAAVGWGVRIVFTLVLGKEAFGTGDIHIMAAAGAVTGWEVVVIGFFLSSILALLGKLLTLPFKGGHAMPMGPWITLGLFMTVLLREPLTERLIEPARMAFHYWWPGAG